jgi:hypothetical protein
VSPARKTQPIAKAAATPRNHTGKKTGVVESLEPRHWRARGGIDDLDGVYSRPEDAYGKQAGRSMMHAENGKGIPMLARRDQLDLLLVWAPCRRISPA